MSVKQVPASHLTRRRLVQASAAAGMVAALPAAARTAGAQEPLRIAFSVSSLAFPFFQHMINLAEAHAAEIGVELMILDGQQSGQPSSTKQSSDLEKFRSLGRNAL